MDNYRPYFQEFKAYKATMGTEILGMISERNAMSASSSSRRGKLQLEKKMSSKRNAMSASSSSRRGKLRLEKNATKGTEILEMSSKRNAMSASGSSRRGKLQLEKNEIPLIRTVLTQSN